jgi:hypothetical protein
MIFAKIGKIRKNLPLGLPIGRKTNTGSSFEPADIGGASLEANAMVRFACRRPRFSNWAALSQMNSAAGQRLAVIIGYNLWRDDSGLTQPDSRTARSKFASDLIQEESQCES